jgi:hypothetical protein
LITGNTHNQAKYLKLSLGFKLAYSIADIKSSVAVLLAPMYSSLDHNIIIAGSIAADSNPEARFHSATANMNKIRLTPPGVLRRGQETTANDIDRNAVIKNIMELDVNVYCIITSSEGV